MDGYIEEFIRMGYHIDYDGYMEEFILTRDGSDIEIKIDDFFNFFRFKNDNFNLVISLIGPKSISVELDPYSKSDYHCDIRISEYEKGAELTSFNELLGFINKDECTIDNYAETIKNHLNSNEAVANNKQIQEVIDMMIPLFKIVKGKKMEKEKEKAKIISKRRSTN